MTDKCAVSFSGIDNKCALQIGETFPLLSWGLVDENKPLTKPVSSYGYLALDHVPLPTPDTPVTRPMLTLSAWRIRR
jgi:hypothetical protein